MIQCPAHGLQGCILTSPDAAKQVAASKCPSALLWVSLWDENGELLALRLTAEHCHVLGIDPVLGIYVKDGEDFPEFFHDLPSVCLECLRELEEVPKTLERG